MKRAKRKRITLQDFFESEVRPALAARLSAAFPEFGFRRGRGEWWIATEAPPGFEDYGARERKLTANQWGFRSYKASAVGVPWTAYVLGRTEAPRGSDFADAVKKLADRLGLDASALDRERTPEQAEEDRRRARIGDLFEDFVALSRAALMDESGGKSARAYLARRGFKSEELDGLPFGFFASPKTVESALVDLGYSSDEVKSSGLVTTREGAPLNSWAGRIVFPWRDERGRISTVVARDISGKAEDALKYLYLRDREKGTAFGLDVAVRSDSARREGLVLVEGLVDVILLQSLGRENVAALGGAGDLLTAERWERLTSLGVSSLTLVLDNDEPGRKGLEKALDNLAKVGNDSNVYVVDPSALGSAKDPDELVREKGLDAFSAVLKSRRPWVSWRGAAILGDVTADSSEVERRDAAGRVLDFVDVARGPRVTLDQEELLRITSERTGYSFEALSEIASDAAKRRRRESSERTLDAVLRTAASERADGSSFEDVVSGLEEGLASVQASAEDVPPPLSLSRWLEEKRAAREGLASGWGAVDAMGVRFSPSELAILGARTGHGKTSAVVGLLKNWLDGETVEGPLVFYSLEEPEDRIIDRLVALETCSAGEGWTANEVRAYLRSPDGDSAENPYSRERDWPSVELLQEAIERIRSYEDRLQIVHRPAWDAKTIAAHARERSAAEPLGAVLVDYLQRIPPTPGFKADRRDQEVSFIGRTFKGLAVDLGVPVVVGAQINREAAQAIDHSAVHEAEDFAEAISEIRKGRPELHHLREGGSEQEADLVLGLLNYAADYRTDARNAARIPSATLFEVGALKNRYGSVGTWASLAFEGRFGLLRDAKDHEADSWQVERTRAADKREEGLTQRAQVNLEVERERTARAEKNRQTAELKRATEDARTERTRIKAEASTMLAIEPTTTSRKRKA